MPEQNPPHARVGKYELLELVERGADGDVYRARNTETSQNVLLKVRSRSAAAEQRYSELSPRDLQPSPDRLYHPYAAAPAPRGVHPGTAVAIVLGLILTGLAGYILGVYTTSRGWIVPPDDTSARRRAVGPGPDGTAPTASGTAAPPGNESDVSPAPELNPPAKALAAAKAQWEALQVRQDYAGGTSIFQKVIDDFPSTGTAAAARLELGTISRQWAHSLERNEDYAEARAKYEQAIALLPPDDAQARSARESLPMVIAKLAGIARADKHFEEAARLYTEAAAGVQKDEDAARRLLQAATVYADDLQDYAKAIETFDGLFRRFPRAQAANIARRQLPKLYAGAARKALAEKQYARARELAALLRKDYAEHPATRGMDEVDAEALLRQYMAALAVEADDREDYYVALFKAYPNSRWTRDALRYRLGYKGGSYVYTKANAAKVMEMSRARYAGKAFVPAVMDLKHFVRSADPELPEFAEAMRKLPQWMYEGAQYQCGRDLPGQAAGFLRDIASLFPHTAWADQANAMLHGMASVPDGMVYVPEGRFTMGTSMDDVTDILRKAKLPIGPDKQSVEVYAREGDLIQETPAHVAETRAYYISRTEVTNRQYKEFVAKTGHAAPLHWENGTYPEGQDDLPVVGVSLADATAYARSCGGRLPTEEEWEKAARGVDGRPFPLGEGFTPKKTRHMLPPETGPVAVGSFAEGASPYGCLDMIGNVGEWTSSRFARYPESTFVVLPRDADMMVVRGGAWWCGSMLKIPARCASRIPADPAKGAPDIGFRYVVDVQPPPAEQDATTQDAATVAP